jgi:hypothetical protein
MKIQLFLIGAVVALSLGALTLADAVPTGSTSNPPQLMGPTAIATPSPLPSPKVEARSTAPSPLLAVVVPAPEPTPTGKPSAHPCNHGFFVSGAEPGEHGGSFTRTVAKSNLGKGGDCTVPPTTPATATVSAKKGSDEQGQKSDEGSGDHGQKESDSG